MTAQKKSEIASLAVSALGTIILGVSTWTLLAVIDIRESIAKSSTVTEYDHKAFAALEERQRADQRDNAAAHASLWAQTQDLRDQMYSHGWSAK